MSDPQARKHDYIRPAFLNPGRELDDAAIGDALALVGYSLPFNGIALWTANDRLAVYDWALREHLSASDAMIKRRPKPALVYDCEAVR